MKKILLVTLSWHTDHQEAVFSMYKQLRNKGFHASTLTIKNSDYPVVGDGNNYFVDAPLNPGIEKKTFDVRGQKALIDILKGVDFDVVYFESFHVWNYPIIFYCKKNKKKIVHVIHDAVIHKGDSNALIKTKLNQTVIDWSNIILTKSELGANTIKEKYPKRAWKVRNVKVWREFSGCSEPKGEYVLFFGRLNLYKGIDYLYKLIEQTPDIRYVVAGKPDETAIDVVSQLRKLNNVKLMDDTVPYSSLDSLFGGARCVVLPYQSATQSGVVIDAFKHSCPVVAFEVGALGEQVSDGNTGYLVELGNVDDMEKKVRELCGMEHDRYLAMCKNAYQAGFDDFSAQSQVDSFIKAIRIG